MADALPEDMGMPTFYAPGTQGLSQNAAVSAAAHVQDAQPFPIITTVICHPQLVFAGTDAGGRAALPPPLLPPLPQSCCISVASAVGSTRAARLALPRLIIATLPLLTP